MFTFFGVGRVVFFFPFREICSSSFSQRYHQTATLLFFCGCFFFPVFSFPLLGCNIGHGRHLFWCLCRRKRSRLSSFSPRSFWCIFHSCFLFFLFILNIFISLCLPWPEQATGENWTTVFFLVDVFFFLVYIFKKNESKLGCYTSEKVKIKKNKTLKSGETRKKTRTGVETLYTHKPWP